MKIALAGTGNVATVLGRLFKQAGHTIVSVSGRDPVKAAQLASLLGAQSFELPRTSPDAEIIIIAVSDDAINKLLKGRFSIPVVHTAGSVPSSILAEYGNEYGVIYPLQSLRKEMQHLPEIPFLINGSDEKVMTSLHNLCNSVSLKVVECSDVERLKLHLAAVLVSNFTNHLYQLAEEYSIKNNISFNLLHPLIEETAMRLKHASPSALQTGPAVRNDRKTIEAHLQLLEQDEKLSAVYQFMTKNIQQPG